MNEQNRIYIKTEKEKIYSLIADEAKNASMLESMASTLKQMQAKNSFRLALLNQLRETIEQKENK